MSTTGSSKSAPPVVDAKSVSEALVRDLDNREDDTSDELQVASEREASLMSAPAESPVLCFLDESGTDAKDSGHAVLAGTVMNRKDVSEFDTAWKSMLARHGLASGLHMIELGPKGRYPHLVGDACAEMLRDAVGVINGCRIFTFGASWDNRKHEALFSEEMRRKYFSVYGLTFMMAVEINRASAANQGYTADIDYVLDDGNRFKKHIVQMYDSIEKAPELAGHKVGSLDFKTDSEVPALQAADVIAWATRRVKAGKELKGVHEPLKGLFDKFYADSPAPDDIVRQMSARFALAEAGLLAEDN